MLSKPELQTFLEAIHTLLNSASDEGCSDDLIVVSKPLLEQLDALVPTLRQAQARRYSLGVHSHRHGDSPYLFLVDAGVRFGKRQFRDHLDEHFEPERDETIGVENDMDVILIPAPHPAGATPAPRGRFALVQLRNGYVVDTENPTMVEQARRAVFEDLTSASRLEGLRDAIGVYPDPALSQQEIPDFLLEAAEARSES